MNELVSSEQQGRVRSLTLQRPEKHNALNAALCRELADAIEAADADASVGAILLAAAGPSFCAGMDLAEVTGGPVEGLSELHERLFTIGARLTKPLVGAVNGAAFGGGVGLAANCHILVASNEAKFGLTEIRLGLWPFLIYRAVEAAMGARRTLELALTGRIFDAHEARALGLVHHIAQDPETFALETARELSQLSPSAIRQGLRFVRETRGTNPIEAGRIGQAIREEVLSSQDFAEGVRAFREHRRPVWPSLGE